MLEKALKLIIGHRWRSFCGISQKNFVELAHETLDDLGYKYSSEEFETSGAEELMLGSDEKGEQITVEAPARFSVEVVTAKSNPVLAYTLKFFSTKDRREEMTSGACVVDLYKIDHDTRPAIVKFMNRLIEKSDHPPWKVTHHAGFRLAVLLRLKIQFFWKYWLRSAKR